MQFGGGRVPGFFIWFRDVEGLVLKAMCVWGVQGCRFGVESLWLLTSKAQGYRQQPEENDSKAHWSPTSEPATAPPVKSSSFGPLSAGFMRM